MKKAVSFLVLLVMLSSNVLGQEGNIFPLTLNWNKVEVVEGNEIIKINSESEFLILANKKQLTYKKGTITKSFDCCVDALFWIFRNELSTNSHYGDEALKQLYRSKL